MAKVLDEQELSICVDCVWWYGMGDIPSEDWQPPKEFEGYTMAIDEQWSDTYDEFSWSRCDSCDSTLGGSRYGCIATLFESVASQDTV